MTRFLRALLATTSAVALSAVPAYAINVERPAVHGQPGGGGSPPPPPSSTYTVYPGCSVPPVVSTGSTWYFDPVNGQTPAYWATYFAANPGDIGYAGDEQHPWNSLIGAISGYWGTANVISNYTYPGYSRPLLSSVPFWHVTTAGEDGLNAGEAIGEVDVADNTGDPPIQPGDTIMLMSGNYGNIFIGAYALSTVNSNWVWIEAAPGQTPVFTTLYAVATNKWVFNGITVQSPKTTPTVNISLVHVGDEGASHPTSDMVFAGMQISSAPSATAVTWTEPEWGTNGRAGITIIGSAGNGTNGEPYTTCVSITGSHMTQVDQGAILQGNNIVFSGNEIDHFFDDGVDFMGSNQLITKNYVHDGETRADGNHPDAFQGNEGPTPVPAGPTYNAYSNVLVDSNVVIRRTDPNLAFPDQLQGITQFDADWTNLVVTNNIVIARSCWAMSFGSDHDSLIANNTAVDDGDTSIVLSGCSSAVNAGGASHEGPASTNVRMTNNLVDHMDINNQVPGSIVADHNVALSWYEPFAQYENGTLIYQVPAGTDVFGNTSYAKPGVSYASVFNTWLPGTWQYDVHLLSGSTVVIGAGTSGSPLPTIDITGVTRTYPYTVGAYGYPN